MIDLELKRRNRFLFLKELYQIVDGNEYAFNNMWEIGEKLGFDKDDSLRIVQYLVGEGLVEFKALGGEIGITHLGVKEIEEAINEPTKPTYHFPAYSSINFININNMNKSSIIQGSTNVYHSENSIDQEALRILENILIKFNEIKLNEDNQDLNAQIETIKSQLKYSKPNKRIIEESLIIIIDILPDNHELASIKNMMKEFLKTSRTK